MTKESAMNISIDEAVAIPIKVQIVNQLRQLILSGDYPPNTKLPSEMELKAQLNVCRETIRQAYYELEKEDLVFRVPGKGRFTKESVTRPASNLIGYIGCDFYGIYQYQILKGVEKAAQEKGYQIVFSNSMNELELEIKNIERLLNERVKGILIYPVASEESNRRLSHYIKSCNVPFVILDRYSGELECDFVSSDNYAGAYNAVEYLIKQGHRNIAFICYPFMSMSSIIERYNGYRDALRAAGLKAAEPLLSGPADREIDPSMLIHEGPEIINMLNLRDRFAAPDRPTAVFAVSDILALVIINALEQMNIRTPQDVSVVCFDNFFINLLGKRDITYVEQNVSEIGRRGMELITRRIEGLKGPLKEILIPTKLKVHNSSVKPVLA